ncbi:hypothetical protein WJX74_006866 [Apatococcus lobatus]|uniref:HP domain-containing protein n=1 Tax=Apatococcus lobatus TaxID=904363 RepID=A0AAW1S267_9CHLO
MPEGNFKELRKSDLRKPEVWSVQRGGAVPVGSADHSKFAEGSCYLVLHTQSIQGTTEGLNIHVWQGKSASKAEADAAAALADELYKTLGSQVLQHRQVQGHESQSFMQAFNGAVFYVRGTAASSKPSGQTVTLSEVQMQGRRSTRVQECAAQASSLRTSGCFILRGSSVIYAWAGSTAPRALRASMLKAAMRLSCSNVEVVPLEEQDRSSPNAQAFYRELGAPDPSTVQIESRASSTAGHASDAMTIPRLFRVTDGSAGPLVGDAFPGTPHAGMLDGETAAMLVAGNMAHFWVSAATGPIDCQTGFDIAEQLLGQLSMPFSAPVQLVQQGTEPDAFWQHLGKGQPSVARSKAEHSTPVSNGTAADASDDAMFADPKSTTTMWRVKGSTATEVPAKQAAQFYSGNVYYIHHSFKDNGAQTHFLFIWQGSDASQIDVEGSGIAANAYDKKRCNGSANQVRVPQGREPSFFPLLFKGKAIFHQGSAEELTKTPMRPALYKLEGSGKAAQSRQVEVQASSLSSSGCFLLLTASSSVFQWQSRASSKDDQKAATGFANRLMPYAIRKTVVAEGEEPDAFWEAIGGKGNYQSEAATAPEPAAHEPQLLLFSEAAPDSLEDLPDYTQEDLDDDEIFLLDAFYTVFVWAGRDSDPAKQKAAQKKGQHLGQRDGRAANTPVSLVLPGQEPSLFTAAFPSWNAKRAAQANDPFQRAMTALSTKQPSQASEPPAAQAAPLANGHHTDSSEPSAMPAAAPRTLSPRMAALMPKSLSRGSSPRKGLLQPAEAPQSTSREAPEDSAAASNTAAGTSEINAHASTAMAPATAHEVASASDSSQGLNVESNAEQTAQAPAFAPRQELAAAPDRHNLAETTSAAMSAQRQGLDSRQSNSREQHQSAVQAPAFATQHERAAAQDRHASAGGASAAMGAQRQGSESRNTDHQLESHALQGPSFATQHEIAAAQDRQFPTEYTAAAIADVDGRTPQPEPLSPRRVLQPSAFAPQQELEAAPDRHNLAESTSAAMTAQRQGLGSRGWDAQPDSSPAQPSSQYPELPVNAGQQSDNPSSLAQGRQQVSSTGRIEIAEPVNGYESRAAEHGTRGEDPQDDTSPARSGRSPVKFGRALPGLANPERDAQNSSVSPAEPSSSPSNHQPQGQSTAASSRREDSRASGEPKPNNMFQSASGDNNGPLVSDSPVKPGRPLPGMAGPASFRQGGAPDATQTSSLSSDRQPHAQNRDSPVSASQPEVSMQLQETQQQLSETSSSGKNPPGTSHLQSGQRHSSEGEIFDASTSSRNQQRGPPPDAHAASPLSAANAAQRQQGSQPAGSQPANAAQHVGNKNGVSGRVMNAPHSHFDDDTRRRYADGTQQSHGARLSTSSAAHNESPSKMQLGQSQPGLSPSTSKQLAQDRASSSEEPSVTIKARHLEGPAANDSESASRAQPSQSAQPSDISGGSRGLKPNNDVSDAGDAVPASASGASSQLPMEVPSAQDKRSFKEAQEAIARATASGQGSVAEAASLERVKPPITRSAVAARASSLEASIAPGARSSEGPGSEEAPRRRISRLNVASIFNAQAALADKGTSAFPKPNLPPASAPPPPPTDLKLFPGQDFIEYEELKGMRAEDGLDMTRKEEYLNDAAFAKVFGQEREAYKKLPRWRQVLLKKQHKLF